MGGGRRVGDWPLLCSHEEADREKTNGAKRPTTVSVKKPEARLGSFAQRRWYRWLQKLAQALHGGISKKVAQHSRRSQNSSKWPLSMSPSAMASKCLGHARLEILIAHGLGFLHHLKRLHRNREKAATEQQPGQKPKGQHRGGTEGAARGSEPARQGDNRRASTRRRNRGIGTATTTGTETSTQARKKPKRHSIEDEGMHSRWLWIALSNYNEIMGKGLWVGKLAGERKDSEKNDVRMISINIEKVITLFTRSKDSMSNSSLDSDTLGLYKLLIKCSLKSQKIIFIPAKNKNAVKLCALAFMSFSVRRRLVSVRERGPAIMQVGRRVDHHRRPSRIGLKAFRQAGVGSCGVRTEDSGGRMCGLKQAKSDFTIRAEDRVKRMSDASIEQV
ncbi:hypothetical protein M5K25_001074 [Dendrobium thyrsiflorum]|uniref:Uncharacterized protein n=1 Tax=Dendrobium thyrsiflorum TaxID=117978 RepID=A0ABD0VVK6_DENTH